MNEHLQNILNLIEQSENLKTVDKKNISKAVKEAFAESGDALVKSLEELKSTREQLESKDRELFIEASLERVRARSLAMHKSEWSEDY